MADGTGLDAPITAVTVFKDGARVQRSGTVSVEPGLRPIVIGNLPATVDPASVRIAAHGRDLVLLNVEVHPRYRADPLRDETTQLRSEVERCRDAVQALDDEDTSPAAAGRHRPPSELAAARGRLDLSPHGAAGDTGDQAAEPGTSRSCGNPRLRPAV